MRQQSSSSAQQQQPPLVGPRAKCDQVVYEAIAKAAEIVVRGRVPIAPNTDVDRNNNSNVVLSARFNIEVEEVESVRSILQRWKRSLHVPLRLDISYEYMDSSSDLRRELLERWCIDYVASTDAPTTTSKAADDTIVQLRQVCKRVVILLRTLHSFTRMMPAYRLHCALASISKSMEMKSTAGEAGNGGMTNGSGAGGYYQFLPTQHHHSGTGSGAIDEMLAATGGFVRFSFYVSGTEGLTEEPLFSSSSRNNRGSPFARQELNSVPTPYGMLHLTVLYDADLDVEWVMGMRTGRLKALEKASGLTRPTFVNLQDFKSAANDEQQHVQKCVSHNYAASPAKSKYPMTTAEMQQRNQQSVNSAPHTQRRILKKSYSQITEQDIERLNLSHSPGKALLLRRESDSAAVDDDIEKKKVLSGLSLAMLNEEHQESNSGERSRKVPPPSDVWPDDAAMRRQRVALHHPPPSLAFNASPISKGGEQQQCLRQLVVPSNTRGIYHPHFHHTSEYGYGYNNGHLVPTVSHPIRICPGAPQSGNSTGSGPLSPSSSLSPLTNTPPQPMFIGSMPRTTTSTRVSLVSESASEDNTSKSTQNSRQRASPPFRNPLSLQKTPDLEVVHASVAQHHTQLQQAPHVYNAVDLTKDGVNLILPPLTSLDILTKSPFKAITSQAGQHDGSFFSSLSMGGGAAYGHNGDCNSFGGPSFGAGAGISMGCAASADASSSSKNDLFAGFGEFDISHYRSRNDPFQPEPYEDMPFAVEIGDGRENLIDRGNTPTGDNAPGVLRNNSEMEITMGASSFNSSTQVVASFAHRCATGKQLKLFSSDSDQNVSHEESRTNGNASRLIYDEAEYRSKTNDCNNLSSLVDQLAEFRMFGATLSVNNHSFSSTPVSTAHTECVKREV